MNLIVIGNGFDLAHGLPTSYLDFLTFVKKKSLYKMFLRVGHSEDESKTLAKQIRQYKNKNLWFDHFFSKVLIGVTWIDFEREISTVIQMIDYARKELNLAKLENRDIYSFYGVAQQKYKELWQEFFPYGGTNLSKDSLIEDIKKRLLIDLNRLIECLDIYLEHYVNRLEVTVSLDDVMASNADCVLSFNYTNTYERVYGLKDVKYHYVHGKTNCNPELQNIILGIDEYLSVNLRDSDNEFIEFKKFFQRIYKKTGAEYKKWLSAEYRQSLSDPFLDIEVYGHSLDVTDADIIRDLIFSDNSKITFYYHNEKAYIEKISKLVKIIGEEKLIELTYNANPKIVFKMQK